MRLFSGKIGELSDELVKSLVGGKHIETEQQKEVAKDLESVFNQYVATDREVSERAKEMSQARPNEYGRLKRLLAEEKRSGTLEMLITLPVKDHAVILGKFIGAWGLVLVLIIATALYPLMMFKFPWHLGALDSGPVISGYLGILLYSAAAVSIGLLISALTDSQVIAFFITWMVLVLLSFLGLLGENMPASAARDVITFVSFDTRLAPFARGQIITRDIVFFLSITVGCLMASFRALERRKWA